MAVRSRVGRARAGRCDWGVQESQLVGETRMQHDRLGGRGRVLAAGHVGEYRQECRAVLVAWERCRWLRKGG